MHKHATYRGQSSFDGKLLSEQFNKYRYTHTEDWLLCLDTKVASNNTCDNKYDHWPMIFRNKKVSCHYAVSGRIITKALTKTPKEINRQRKQLYRSLTFYSAPQCSHHISSLKCILDRFTVSFYLISWVFYCSCGLSTCLYASMNEWTNEWTETARQNDSDRRRRAVCDERAMTSVMV